MTEKTPVLCGLAPMAGVTDAAFRLICSELGADFCVSEMLSAKGWIYSKGLNRNALALLKRLPGEKLCALQLFGRDCYYVSEAVKQLEDAGFEWFDLNFGCPAPKITSSGEGSALMKEPLLIGQIVSAAVKATGKKVTAKIRAGWDRNSVNAVEVARIIEDSGASMITVHPRTREEFYSGRADRDIIRRVKESVDIPVYGNGDIDSARSALDMLETTGCDGLMVGRGAQGNPWIFAEIKAALEGKEWAPPTLDERFSALKRHIDLEISVCGERLGLLEMRKHIGWYIHGLKEAAKYRQIFNRIGGYEELLTALDRYQALQEQ